MIDSAGRPWFNEFGRNALGTIDPKTMALEEHPLPEGTRGRRIALSDGAIWYVDYARGLLSRFDPKTRKVDEFPTPGGKGSLPYAMATDDRGRLWLVETGPQPNRLVGFDPESKKFFASAEVPSAQGALVRNGREHDRAREGAVETYGHSTTSSSTSHSIRYRASLTASATNASTS